MFFASCMMRARMYISTSLLVFCVRSLGCYILRKNWHSIYRIESVSTYGSSYQLMRKIISPLVTAQRFPQVATRFWDFVTRIGCINPRFRGSARMRTWERWTARHSDDDHNLLSWDGWPATFPSAPSPAPSPDWISLAPSPKHRYEQLTVPSSSKK